MSPCKHNKTFTVLRGDSTLHVCEDAEREVKAQQYVYHKHTLMVGVCITPCVYKTVKTHAPLDGNTRLYVSGIKHQLILMTCARMFMMA